MKRRVLGIILTVAIVFSLSVAFPLTASADETSFDASANEPVIATAEDMIAFRTAVNAGTDFSGKTVKLEADIDVSGANWISIGTHTHPFIGTFDGQGHIISGLHQSLGTIGGNAGLFGSVSANSGGTTTIKNFKLTGSGNGIVGNNGGNDAGTVIAIVKPLASGNPITVNISGIWSTVDFDCSGALMKGVGGILGSIGYSSGAAKTTVNIDSCWYSGTLNSPSAGAKDYGGIMGWTREGVSEKEVNISNCLVTGTIIDCANSDYDDFGGIMGFYKGNGATANITGSITDTVFAGTMCVKHTASGYVLGEISNNTHITPKIGISNVYYVENSTGSATPRGWIGYDTNYHNGTPTAKTFNQLTAFTAGSAAFTSNSAWYFPNNGEDLPVPVSLYNAYIAPLCSYPEYPDYIDRDNLYSVSVQRGIKAVPLTVYNEVTGYSHFNKDSANTRVLGASDTNRRFCEFAFDGAAVTVKIKVNKSFSTYTVSPTSKSFASTYANGVISVTLDQPEYFVLMLDNDYNTALAVFADAPETNVPAKGASNVVYVDTDGSITDPSNLITYAGANDEVIKISKNNAKIYIAPGAVLKKRVVFTRTDNDNTSYHCGISGRGMILDPYSDIAASNQNNIPTYTDMGNTQSLQGTVTFHGYGCTMEGVKVINSANYNVIFKQNWGYTNHVKLLSTEMSSDGFTCTAYGGYNAEGLIENSFVYVGDNALVIQNGIGTTLSSGTPWYSGYSFRNITVGTTCAVIYPQYNANTTLEDIYVFRADDGLINVGQSGVGSQTVNVTNLDALDCVKIPTLFKAWNAPGTATKTFNLNNVVMRYTTGSNGSFTPGTTTANKVSISNTNSSSNGYVLNLTNLYMGGQQVNGTCNYLMGNISNYYSNAYPTSNGITINFAVNGANLPAHTSIPVAQTANHTHTGTTYTGPGRGWTRYQAYKCNAVRSGSAYTVTTTQSGSTTWGLSKDITNLVRANGTGDYKFTIGSLGKSVKVYVVKCSPNSGTTTTVVNGRSFNFLSKTVGFTVDDVNAVWQIIIKSNADSGYFSVSGLVLSKL